MFKDPFQSIMDDAQDFKLLFSAVRSSDRAIGEVTSAIESRITDEKEQNVSRAEELEKRLADSSRSSALKGLDAAELEKLRMWTPDPSSVEETAFETALTDFERSLAEVREARGKLIDEFQAVQAIIEAAKKDTIHNPTLNIELFANVTERRRNEFNAMLRRVHEEVQ